MEHGISMGGRVLKPIWLGDQLVTLPPAVLLRPRRRGKRQGPLCCSPQRFKGHSPGDHVPQQLTQPSCHMPQWRQALRPHGSELHLLPEVKTPQVTNQTRKPNIQHRWKEGSEWIRVEGLRASPTCLPITRDAPENPFRTSGVQEV